MEPCAPNSSEFWSHGCLAGMSESRTQEQEEVRNIRDYGLRVSGLRTMWGRNGAALRMVVQASRGASSSRCEIEITREGGMAE